MKKFMDIIHFKILDGTFWTDRLHLVSGCSPVSPGCLNCWMVAEARLRGNHPLPGVRMLHEGLLTPDKKHFNGTVRFNAHLLEKAIPKSNRRAPRVWAVWTDLHHEDLFREDIQKAYELFRSVPSDYFVVVTKRPERAVVDLRPLHALPNVIILVTMEDQERADKRAPDAVELAAQGWNVGILAEPLLGPLDIRTVTIGSGCFNDGKHPIKWIITGGESGPGARPARIEWVRSLRDQAVAAGVPFMFKSWGAWRPADLPAGKQGMAKVQRGDIGDGWLDGRTWSEGPDL